MLMPGLPRIAAVRNAHYAIQANSNLHSLARRQTDTKGGRVTTAKPELDGQKLWRLAIVGLLGR